MDRRSGKDRRANVIVLEQPVSQEVVSMAKWFVDFVTAEREHSTIIISCGRRLKCRVFFAGHAKKYARLMAGELTEALAKVSSI